METKCVETQPLYNKAAIEDIASTLKRLQNDLQIDSALSQEVQQDFDFVYRAIRQFEKLDKMIIVICGMLKAGKSTLINLLARSDRASPVDFGVDTTMRPALVRRSDTPEGCIRCYYTDDDACQKALLQIFDVLRGVELVEHARFTEEKVVLTPQNLKEYLCGSLGDGSVRHMTREPLLVVVEIPSTDDPDCLLASNIMLLDMPGLDSGKARTAIEGYADVVAECDMMFYVQSSVSPLNYKAKELLKCVLAHRHSETTYVIQNRMMAQTWRREDLQLDDQSRQGHKALDELKQCFEESSEFRTSSGIRYASMNLGMAYDALTDAKDNHVLNSEGKMPDGKPITSDLLMECSSFRGFESDVRKILHDSGLRYRVMHCVDNLGKQLVNLQEKLTGHVEKRLAPDRTQTESICKAWARVEKKLMDIQERGAIAEMPQAFILAERFEKKLLSELQKSWENMRDHGDDKFRQLIKKGERAPGSILDSFLKQSADAMAKCLTETFNECALNDVEVKLRDGLHSLRELLNDSLREGTFKPCGSAANANDEDIKLFQEIETSAPAGYEYEPRHKLKDESGEHRFEPIEPSALDGMGYPFYQQTTIPVFGNMLGFLGEDKKAICNMYTVLDKMTDDYLNAIRNYVSENGVVMMDKLLCIGKERGLKNAFDYIGNHSKESCTKLEDINRRLAAIKKCKTDIDDLKQKIKELY